MKAFTILSALAAIITASSAFAQEITTPCKFENYQELQKSLKEMEIRAGKELKGEVLDVLAQEMGPTCELVIDMNRVGIPGRASKDFRLKTGVAQYNVSIVRGGVEDSNQSWVNISKNGQE